MNPQSLDMLLDSAGLPIIVQGITGKIGSLHTELMLEYGTKVVGGVVPGKGGQSVHGVPVFNTVKEAVAATSAKASINFVPAAFFFGAAEEAVRSGLKLTVAITEQVPVRDTLKLLKLSEENNATVIGPNTPGVIVPSRTKIGIMPPDPFEKGKVAVFSRSGTLMYEVAYHLSRSGFGQAIALGIGGDPINCTNLIECLDWVHGRKDIEAVVVVGEIGGDVEEKAVEHLSKNGNRKPMVAYVAGRYAPKEKKMGHAGAIILGSYGTAESKIKTFEGAGIPVALRPAEIPVKLGQVLKR